MFLPLFVIPLLIQSSLLHYMLRGAFKDSSPFVLFKCPNHLCHYFFYFIHFLHNAISPLISPYITWSTLHTPHLLLVKSIFSIQTPPLFYLHQFSVSFFFKLPVVFTIVSNSFFWFGYHYCIMCLFKDSSPFLLRYSKTVLSLPATIYCTTLSVYTLKWHGEVIHKPLWQNNTLFSHSNCTLKPGTHFVITLCTFFCKEALCCL